jgi:hypothetical protein
VVLVGLGFALLHHSKTVYAPKLGLNRGEIQKSFIRRTALSRNSTHHRRLNICRSSFLDGTKQQTTLLMQLRHQLL